MLSILKSLVGPPMCDHCGLFPKDVGSEFCDEACAADAAEQKRRADAIRGSGGGRGGATSNRGYNRNNFSSVPGSYTSAAAGLNYGFDSMMCEQCGIRVKNQERRPGGQQVLHPFCGRNCAEIARQNTSIQQEQYAQTNTAAAPPVTRATTLDSARASRMGSRGVQMDSDEDSWPEDMPSSKKPYRNAYDDYHNDGWGTVQSPLPKPPPVNPGISRAYSCCGCTINVPSGSLPLECPICKLAEVKKELEAEKAKPPVAIRKEADGSARRQLDEDDDGDDDFFVRQPDPPPEGTPVHYCG